MMQIDGLIGSSIAKEIQPKQNQTQASVGPSFLESIVKNALRTDLVVRGNEMSAAGLSSKKVEEHWDTNFDEEKEDSIEDIFNKINRIDEILKEKFSK
jgi:hypothetical protein